MTRRLAAGGDLSELEAAVLRLAADGLTIGEIARALATTVAAAQDSRHRLFGKLGAKSMPHAVLLACRAGILDGRPRRHGDHAGYAAHQYRGEEPCEACRAGERAYRNSRRSPAQQPTAATGSTKECAS